MRGGRINEWRRARGCARRAPPELSVACGAAGGGRRTGIVSSMVELTLAFLFFSEDERAVDREHHLVKGPRGLPMTCAAKNDSCMSEEGMAARFACNPMPAGVGWLADSWQPQSQCGIVRRHVLKWGLEPLTAHLAHGAQTTAAAAAREHGCVPHAAQHGAPAPKHLDAARADAAGGKSRTEQRRVLAMPLQRSHREK